MPLFNVNSRAEQIREARIQQRQELIFERKLSREMFRELSLTYRQAARMVLAADSITNVPLQNLIAKHRERTKRLLRSIYMQVGVSGVSRASAELNRKVTWETNATRILNTWSGLQSQAVSNQISSTTLDKLLKLIFQAQNEAWTSKRLANDIVKVSRGSINRNRALTIARTEVHKSSQASLLEGTKIVAEENDVKIMKVWNSNQDNRTRHSHRIINKEAVDMDGKFQVGDYQLSHPGDPVPGAQKEFINCRCFLTFKEVKNNEGIA